MKASQIIQGTRALRRVPLPSLCGRPSPEPSGPEGQAAVLPSGPPDVAVRALTGTEYMEALQGAAQAALDAKTDPKPGNPLYDLRLAAELVWRGCEDPDQPGGKFFDGGLSQILGSPDLGRDGILTLAEQVELENTAHRAPLTTDELNEAIVKLCQAGGSEYFLALAPSTRVNLALSMAGLLLTLVMGRSASGSSSEAAGTS